MKYIVDKKATGKRIKELSKKKGITQIQLANELDKNKRTISNWYSGETLPQNIDELKKLSWILDTPIDEIIVMEDSDEHRCKWEELSVIEGIDSKRKITTESNLTYKEEQKKAIAKIGVSIETIDRTLGISRHGVEGYYWTEVHNMIALPDLNKKVVYNYIKARNEYEYLSGEEFETDEWYEIDLGQILASYLLKETDILNKRNATLKRNQRCVGKHQHTFKQNSNKQEIQRNMKCKNTLKQIQSKTNLSV